MRYFTHAALLALLTVVVCTAVGCDQSGGSSGIPGVSGGSGTPAALSITTTTIPSFTVPGAPGTSMPPYTATISATGGTGTYSWSIVAGTLPNGLSIAPTGTPDTTISGTMTSPVTTSFTVQVTDSNSATATMAYTLVVNYAPTPPPAPVPLYYGSSVAGRVLFICDISSATNGTAHWDMIHELNAAIGGLSATDEFDILIYNDTLQGGFEAMAGMLVPATSTNITAALLFVNSTVMTPAGSPDNACYAALQDSFASYTGVDDAFLFTWTTPGDASNILVDYPNWAASDPNRELTVIAKNSANSAFGQQLAALAGGTFVP